VEERDDSAKQPCLAFFVDDLDRCAPTQVVEVVNAINQIFNSVNGRRCVFVLGMDRDVVAASIDVVYHDTISTLAQHHSELGRSFGLHFLAKLVQMSVAIPRPADDALKRHLATLTKNDVPDEASARPSEARVVEIQSAIEAEKPVDLTEVAAIEQRLAAEAVPAVEGRGTDAFAEASSRARAEWDAALREAARRSRAKRLNADDPKVWQAEQDAVPVLAGNPRQVKRFDNAYRLQLHVALNSERPPQFTPAQLAVMAKWVAIRLRWPSLATAMDANPELVEALEKHANGKSAAVPNEWKAFEEWFTMPELSKILTERSRTRRLTSLSHAFLNVT